MLALVFAAVLPLLPDQAPPPASPGATPPAGPAPRAFSRLFSLDQPPPGDGRQPTAIAEPRNRVRKKVVCGMTLLIVDGSIDPKMAIAPNRKDVDPGMPRVPKPMCRQK